MNSYKNRIKHLLFGGLLTLNILSSINAVIVEYNDGRKVEGNILSSDDIIYVKSRDFEEEIDFKKISRIKFNDLIKTYVLIPSEYQPPQILIRHGVPLEQSEIDAINGIVGTGFPLNKKEVLKIHHLTDAKNAKEPSDDNGWFAGEVIWDLGDKMNPLERELVEVSIWIRSDDKSRCDYSGSLEISEGGKIFIPIDGTYTNVNFYELFGRGFINTFNNVRYFFSPGSVTGFRYLKFKANPSPQNHNESRFVEVDVFVNRAKVPSPKVICIHLENGTILQGILKEINESSVKLTVEKVEFIAPMAKISKILFRNLNQDHQKFLNSERRGILLRNDDFIDGDVTSIDEDILVLSSPLLGEKKFSIRMNVVAIFLKKRNLEKPSFRVMTKFGSSFNGYDLKVSHDNVEFKDSILGKIAFDFDKIAEIEFFSN